MKKEKSGKKKEFTEDFKIEQTPPIQGTKSSNLYAQIGDLPGIQPILKDPTVIDKYRSLQGSIANLQLKTDPNLIYGMANLGAISPSLLGAITTSLFGVNKVLNTNIFSKTLDLNEELSSLKRRLSETIKKYDDTNSDKLKLNEELEKLKMEIKNNEGISHILPRICLQAQENLLTSEKFKNLFEDGKNCECVVVSIDIRRSTELMLKAKSPKLFSTFITQLSNLLSIAIIENFGILTNSQEMVY